VFTVLVSHDHWIDASGVTDQLTRHDIQLLSNASQFISPGLIVAGLDDYWEGPAHLTKVLDQATIDDDVIPLSHNPDINQEITSSDPVNRVLSGHTYGGQVCIPLLNQAL
jgi:predicted MPP superfamily phosphohydrolase